MTGVSDFAIDRLSIALDGLPGIDGAAFHRALVQALGRLDLPENVRAGRLGQFRLPLIEARPGDTAERLALRTADALARAIREHRP